jgi:hypothetical protein
MKLLHVYHLLLLDPMGTSLCTVWKGPPKAQQTNRAEQQLSGSRTALEAAISADPLTLARIPRPAEAPSRWPVSGDGNATLRRP